MDDQSSPNLLDHRWHTEGRMIFADLPGASISESFVGIMDDADLAHSVTADHNHAIGRQSVEGS